MIVREMKVQQQVSKKTGNPYNVLRIRWVDVDAPQGDEVLYTFQTFVTEEQSYCIRQMLNQER